MGNKASWPQSLFLGFFLVLFRNISMFLFYPTKTNSLRVGSVFNADLPSSHQSSEVGNVSTVF